MKLFDNEKLLMESDKGIILLTNKRIRYYHNAKKSDYTSIVLKNISSIKVDMYQKSYMYFIGGIVAIFSEFLIPLNMNGLGALIGIALLFIFFSSRKHVILIDSKGGQPILFATKGIKDEFVADFVNKIENAILEDHNEDVYESNLIFKS